MNRYEVLGTVGEGAYGVVLKCRNKESGRIVAVKKFKESEDKEVVRKTTMRELKLLRMLRHQNIVLLLEAFRRKGRLHLVFEYVEQNLLQVLENHPSGLEATLVQIYTFQLCKAIAWCHENGVVHRDIKPENLLVDTKNRRLKLCDFGFARVMPGGERNLTDYVATRWYRAPELLLGSTAYDFSVDVWAIGCIMGELTDGQPLFPGESEIDQLYTIQKMLGPLTSAQTRLFRQSSRFEGASFSNLGTPETLQTRYMGSMGKKALFFIRSIVVMEPVARLSIQRCLRHNYFEDLKQPTEDPPAMDKTALDSPQDQSFRASRQRKEIFKVDGIVRPPSDTDQTNMGMVLRSTVHAVDEIKEDSVATHLRKIKRVPDEDNLRLPSTRRLGFMAVEDSGEDTQNLYLGSKNSGKRSSRDGSRKARRLNLKVSSRPNKADRKKKSSSLRGNRLRRPSDSDVGSNATDSRTTQTNRSSIASTAIPSFEVSRDVPVPEDEAIEEIPIWEDPYDFEVDLSGARAKGFRNNRPRADESARAPRYRPSPPPNVQPPSGSRSSHGSGSAMRGQQGRSGRFRHTLNRRENVALQEEQVKDQDKHSFINASGAFLLPMKSGGQLGCSGREIDPLVLNAATEELYADISRADFAEEKIQAQRDQDPKDARTREINAFKEFSMRLPAKLKKLEANFSNENVENCPPRYPSLGRIAKAAHPKGGCRDTDLATLGTANGLLPQILQPVLPADSLFPKEYHPPSMATRESRNRGSSTWQQSSLATQSKIGFGRQT